MTFALKRTEVAEYLSAELSDYKVYPTRPNPLRTGSGWLDFKSADTQDSAFGEYRVTYDLVLAIGTDEKDAQSALDNLSAPLLDALAGIGTGVSIEPLLYSIDGQPFYCAVANFSTIVGPI